MIRKLHAGFSARRSGADACVPGPVRRLRRAPGRRAHPRCSRVAAPACGGNGCELAVDARGHRRRACCGRRLFSAERAGVADRSVADARAAPADHRSPRRAAGGLVLRGPDGAALAVGIAGHDRGVDGCVDADPAVGDGRRHPGDDRRRAVRHRLAGRCADACGWPRPLPGVSVGGIAGRALGSTDRCRGGSRRRGGSWSSFVLSRCFVRSAPARTETGCSTGHISISRTLRAARCERLCPD